VREHEQVSDANPEQRPGLLSGVAGGAIRHEPLAPLTDGLAEDLPGEKALRAVLAAMTASDVEELVRWHAPNVEVRYPYAPPTFPALITGRAALHEFEAAVAAKIESCRFHDVRIRGLAVSPTGSADGQCVAGLLAEYRGSVVLKSGRPYDNIYCSVMDIDGDGLLLRVTKYYNPSTITTSGLDAPSA
jgi:ketosteroid isomerase-like protein